MLDKKEDINLHINQAKLSEQMSDTVKLIEKIEHKMAELGQSVNRIDQARSYFMGIIFVLSGASGLFIWQAQNMVNDFRVWNKAQDVQIQLLQEKFLSLQQYIIEKENINVKNN